MKKLIILLAALALLATTILAHADALPEFEFDAAAGRITAYNGPGGEVALPGEIDGARVWDVQGPIFQNNESVTSLALPEGMDVMNDNLTSQVPNLASVTLPQSLRVICRGKWGSTLSFPARILSPAKPKAAIIQAPPLEAGCVPPI